MMTLRPNVRRPPRPSLRLGEVSTKRPSSPSSSANWGGGAGSILLEVILAIVLFAGAAAVVGIGLKAAMDGAERLRMGTHAGNLAVTVMSELQMGLRSLADTGPEAFGPPFEGWMWEIAATPWSVNETTSDLMNVEVVVRHEPTEFVHRLAQVIHITTGASLDGSSQLLAP